ncbi:MAG: S1C family serine protease [Candidatus Kapaibacterium sp.]
MKTVIRLVIVLVLTAVHVQSCSKDPFPWPEKAAASQKDREDKNASVTGSRKNAITSVARECSSAIVGINVTEMREYTTSPFGGFGFGFDDPFFGNFYKRFEQRYTQKVQSLGSGFIVSADGYIVTNDHVAGRASKIVVTMTSGEKYDAEIIGSDPTSDVALLKIKAKNLPYLTLGNSDDVMVGEWSIAFGNPFGLFDKNSKPTVTVGVVSNTGVSFSENSEGVNRVYKNMIQTDAAISSGNSGGPLVNVNGEVIGVNTIIFSTSNSVRGSGSIGIGFAIPVNRVKKIIAQLKDGEKLDRKFTTGLSVDFLTEESARYYKVKRTEGVIVTQVMSNSPASRAGIEPGDILLEIDGAPMHTNDDVSVAINDAVVGQKLRVRVERDGEPLDVVMMLEKRR